MAAVTADASLFSPRPTHDPSAPQPAAAGAAQQPATDALDDLFNYDADIDAVFGDVNNPTAQRSNAQGQPAAAGNDGAGLGIDEEIKIRKPRKRAAKLDEERLLSDKGILKLRKISKDRLKFRGKGHEFSDVSRLLNTYQLWLDDMFPKAKFGDGLALIEKLGHKKRLQVMRKTWIDEEKHKDDNYDVADVDGDFVLGDDNVDSGNRAEDNNAQRDEDERPEDSDHDDLYTRPTPAPTIERNAEEPAEDELDALLAEGGFEEPPQGQAGRDSRTADIDDFADDEEAMAGMW